jgi:hypothetical protein
MMIKKPVPMTPADAARAAEVSAIFIGLENVMCSLSCRWADEHEYEDIREYQAVIEKHLDTTGVTGFAITAMRRRPFGFSATYKNAVYVFTAGARDYKYKRTK